MSKVINLDLLIVYSSKMAISSSVADTESLSPFLLGSKQDNYNPAYLYFLQVCKNAGLKAGFASSADIIGPGMCRSYWSISESGKNWVKVTIPAKSNHIFDKISPASAVLTTQKQLLFSESSIIPFNDAELFLTFFDKLKTYNLFTEFAIPTVEVTSANVVDISTALQKLQVLVAKHPHSSDFSSDIILKDRFGASGNHVYKITADKVPQIQGIVAQNKDKVQFILQPFTLFDSGYSYKNHATATDIRLIFHHDKLLQSYIRMAQGDEFRCNEHQGGELVYVNKSDIPTSVFFTAKKMVSEIKRPQSLYALDFVVSNSGNVFFLEGNIGPGLDWNPTSEINKKMSHQLIQSIVDEFAIRVGSKKRLSH